MLDHVHKKEPTAGSSLPWRFRLEGGSPDTDTGMKAQAYHRTVDCEVGGGEEL